MNCEFMPNSAMATAKLASGATSGAPPEPKCRHSGMSASWAAASSGSQWSEWYEGRPRRCGASVKRDRLRPLRRGALDLGDRRLDVPEREHHHRDEAVRRSAAPLVEHEVVPRRHAGLRQVLVGGAEERAAGEARERREAHLDVDPVGVHVGEPVLHLVAAGQHLLEAHGVHPELLRVLPRDRVEADVRDQLVLEDPDLVRRRAPRCEAPAPGTWPAVDPLHTVGCSTTWSSTDTTWTSSGSMPTPSPDVDQISTLNWPGASGTRAPPPDPTPLLHSTQPV